MRSVIPAVLALAALSLPLAAQELNTGTDRSIIVQPQRPPQAPINVSVSLNRGGTTPSYRPGDTIAITVSPNRDAYIYLYSVEATGAVQRIAPNTYDNQQIFVRGGTSRRFPDANSPYQFTVSPPYGQASVFAVASEQPLSAEQLSTFSFLRTLPTANAGRAISVAPPPSNTYSTGVQRYWVSY